MPCQTCRWSGHNTTTCPCRKVATIAFERVGAHSGHLAGAFVGAHAGAPHAGAVAGGYVGKRLGHAAADLALMTDAQKKYAARKK